MTTVAVFAPLFFLSGIVGKFISSIPFTIIFVLMASIIVALGFVPLLSVSANKGAQEIVSKICKKIGHIARRSGIKNLRQYIRQR